MRKYEFTYILDPGVDDNAVAQSLERYVKLIRDQGGDVQHQEVWGRRRLAYEIRHKIDGAYVHIRFRAERQAVDELNRALHFDEQVLRTLIVLDGDAEQRNAEAQRKAGVRAAPAETEAGAAEARS